MYKTTAKEVFSTELKSIKKTLDNLNKDYDDAINLLLQTKGSIICVGIGKAGHIASKISSTLSSLGNRSYFLHPSEGLHGDLGLLDKNDTIILFSKSGESHEVISLMPSIKKIGCETILISSNVNSTLAKLADINLIFHYTEEASINKLAPTSSTTAMLVLGDSIAVVLEKFKGFSKNDFAILHPSGLIGKKLNIKVKDLMIKDKQNPVVNIKETLKNAIIEMSSKGIGMISVVDDEQKLKGIVTDGDIRRILESIHTLSSLNSLVSNFINNNPVTVDSNLLAIHALEHLSNRSKPISFAPVIDENKKCVGVIKIADILKIGF